MAILFKKTQQFQTGGKPRVSTTTTYGVDSDFDKMSEEQKKQLGIYNATPVVSGHKTIIRENQYTPNGPLLIKTNGKDVTTQFTQQVPSAFLKTAENISRFKRNSSAIADDLTGGTPIESMASFNVSPGFAGYVNKFGQDDNAAYAGVQQLPANYVVGSFAPGGQKQYANKVSYPLTKEMYLKYGPQLRELMEDPKNFQIFERYFQNK